MKTQIFTVIILLMCSVFAFSDVEAASKCSVLFEEAEKVYESSDNNTAIAKFESARVCYDETGGVSRSAECTDYMGDIYKKMDDKEKALSLFQQAHDLRASKFGADDPETAKSYDNLGLFYMEAGEVKKGGELVERSLAIREEKLGGSDRWTGESYVNVGAYLYYTGDYARALDYFKKGTKILEDTLGREHRISLEASNNIGFTYIELGDYEKANAVFDKVLDAYKKKYGENNLKTANTIEAIAINYYYLGDYGRAIEGCEKALASYRSIYGPNSAHESNCLITAGVCHAGLSEFEPALKSYQDALSVSIANAGENHPDTALIYNNIATMLIDMGSYDKALENAEHALAIYLNSSVPEHPNVGYCYNNLGRIHAKRGEFDKAIEFHGKALALRRRIYGEKHFAVAESYGNLGGVYDTLYEMDKAMEYHSKALDIFLGLYGEENRFTATAYANIAHIMQLRGDPENALRNLHKALEIEEKLFGKGHINTADILNNIGTAYSDIGDYGRAKEYYLRSADATIKAYGAEHAQTASRMNNLGILYLDIGDDATALKYLEKALDIKAKLLGEKHPLTALGHVNIAYAYEKSKDYKNAEEHYLKAENVFLSTFGQENVDIANVYNNLGGMYYDIGEYPRSSEYYDKAIRALCEKSDLSGAGCRKVTETVLAFRGKAVAELMLEDYKSAAQDYEAASDAIDELRLGIASDESKKLHSARFFSMFPEGIGTYGALAAQTGDDRYLEKAVEFAEKGISRAFLEMIGRSMAELDGGLPDEVKEEGAALLARVNAAREAAEEEEKKTGAERSQSARTAAYAALREAEADLSEYEKKLLSDFPDFADLMNPKPKPLKEIRGKALLPGEAALVFYLGKMGSYSILISKDKISMATLPKSEDIENLVKLYRMKLTKPGTSIDSLKKTGRKLCEIMIDPLASELAKFDKLLIVPTGQLYFLPFEALVMSDGEYLVEKYDIRYTPSLNVAFLVAKRRTGTKNAKVKWIGYGDPVYPGDDRIKERALSSDTKQLLDSYTRALTSSEDGTTNVWARIPGTGEEVKAIAGMITGGQGDALVNIGMDANEANFKRAAGTGARFIHMATHGSLGEGGARQPAIVLSLVGNEDTGEDGFLTMSEVFNMKIPAEIVVLSACETGRGKMERGEGVAGMARAFLYSGADSLVVSLWSVADKETKDLMVGFYKRLVGGMQREAALRETKLDMIHKDMHPFYWAPFVYIGTD